MRRANAVMACLLLAGMAPTLASASNIVIEVLDDPGEGFNDPGQPRSATQIGNNPGSNLGEMRFNVFAEAGEVWGALLDSNVDIHIGVKFDELFCSENSGTLGSAGATATGANFPGGDTNIAYPVALAEALAGANLNDDGVEINATFNSLVDSDETCLGGGGFYYGLDGMVPAGQADLFSTVLHEIAHGLGFASYTDVAPEGDGDFLGAGGFPDAFSRNLRDLETGKSWDNMTNGERKASALNEPALVWNGANVTAERVNHLDFAPELVINAPAGISGTFEALLGDEPTIVIPNGGVTADVIDGNNFGDGCSQINEGSFSGKIILFDATDSCTAAFPAFFSEFATNAIGVIVAATTDNGLPDMGGQISNQEITIPYIGVTKAVADDIRANIGSANVTIRRSTTIYSGENQGKVKMHAPGEYDPGGSASHWSSSAAPDLLMEPKLGTLDHKDVDLTLAAFKDMGWTPAQIDMFINAGLNDAWVSDGAPFQGLFFTVYPELGFFFLSWFTFDSVPPGGAVTATLGAPDTRWVTGGAFYAGASVTVPVELTSGGIFNGSNPTASQEASYGTITIEFLSCSEARMTYNFPSEGLSGVVTLRRVVKDNEALCEALLLQGPPPAAKQALAGPAGGINPTAAVETPGPRPESSQVAVNINAGMNDAWVSAGAPFQGLFFTVYPDLGFFFLSWFTFDSVPPGGGVTATFGAPDTRWVTGGAFYAGSSVTVPVELTSGGIFNGSNPTASQEASYGTITIDFVSCNEATLSYNFPSESLSGMMTLTRVLNDNVALCQALAVN